ncbi:penicillin-binding protein 2 [Inhella gelatinilytica]|uniref:Peptidoglycan D,D-transpeptidase MrdA n=1 Tax=Inhella gelatinilytica TaxID=2795030 RepID=A0A931IXJ0_9BURK|nr:penicillin-binding protein 2 [Inhella gelatinilytica]MBH9551843.1 penicillin-binding protein 2 [Inhella gelatinilytica]
MALIRDSVQELARFRLRVWVALGFVAVCFALLLARLFTLQVLRHDELHAAGEANRVTVVPIAPNRGLIKDRNGVVLASNYSAYTLEITPTKADRDLNALIDELATVVDIQPRDRRRFFRLLADGKRFDSLPIRNRLSDAEVAMFVAQRWRFPGVDVQARLFRQYPLGEVGSHLLGYIGRISPKDREQMEVWDEERLANYKGTDYIGKLGLEQSYESELHGTTGYQQVETSAGGRAVRSLGHRPPTPGNSLQLSVDIKLQHLVEEMFGDRRGALVALDPRNGEVLAFVSKPGFDPNLFVDGIDVENWKLLNESIDKPLLNRALRGTYPPGSTYKPFMALALLNTGVRRPDTIINDTLVYHFGGRAFGSPENERGGAMDMRRSIVESSNVYYYSAANELGVDRIHDQMEPLGFGRRTDIDLEGEVTGILPNQDWKRRVLKQKWFPGETISLGIGQGYNAFTVLQMATATATLASGGQRFKPRLVREVEDVVHHTRRRVSGEALPPLNIKAEHVAVLKEALHGVTYQGTSTRSFAGAPYPSGGKTGTAQAVGMKAGQKYNAAQMEERRRDHAWYMAFAPVDQPQVALALIVENSGFGGQNAAPIARRVFDYLLLGQVPSEEDLALVREGKALAPMGKPRLAADWRLPGEAGFVPPPASAATNGSAAPAPRPSASGGVP